MTYPGWEQFNDIPVSAKLITINYYMCVEERDIVNCLLILQISYL